MPMSITASYKFMFRFGHFCILNSHIPSHMLSTMKHNIDPYFLSSCLTCPSGPACIPSRVSLLLFLPSDCACLFFPITLIVSCSCQTLFCIRNQLLLLSLNLLILLGLMRHTSPCRLPYVFWTWTIPTMYVTIQVTSSSNVAVFFSLT